MLNAEATAPWCERGHLAVSPDLSAFIEVAWTLRWNLKGRNPHEQRVLPNPCVHITVDSRGGANVVGPHTGPYATLLDGEAFVLGVKFRPGGFRPFLRTTVAALTDRTLPLGEVLPALDVAGAVERAGGADGRSAMRLLEDSLRMLHPIADERLALVGAVVTLIANEPSLQRVEQVASAAELSVRALQRLFREHVGVSPNWMIRRARLKELAARIEAGEVENWAALASALGYFDQAHLINDFTAMVGEPPARYAGTVRTNRADDGRGE